MVLLGRRLEHA